MAVWTVRLVGCGDPGLAFSKDGGFSEGPTQVGLAGYGHVVAPRSDFVEEELEVVAANVHVQEHFSRSVHDAGVHLCGMQIDAAVVLGCRSVVSHLVVGCMLFGNRRALFGSVSKAFPLSGAIKPQNEGLDEFQGAADQLPAR